MCRTWTRVLGKKNQWHTEHSNEDHIKRQCQREPTEKQTELKPQTWTHRCDSHQPLPLSSCSQYWNPGLPLAIALSPLWGGSEVKSVVMTRAEALTSNYPPAGLRLALGHSSLTHTCPWTCTHSWKNTNAQCQSLSTVPKLSQTVCTHYKKIMNTSNIHSFRH